MTWNYNISKFTVQFDDLPLNVELKFRLLDWYQVLSNDNLKDTKNPISLQVQSLQNFNLNYGKCIQNNQIFQLHVWKGIYSKWEQAEIKGTIDSNKPVNITMIKLKAKSWRISTIEQPGLQHYMRNKQ